MNRLSLIQNVNQILALGVACAIWIALLVLRAPGLTFQYDRLRADDAILIPLLLGAAILFSRVVNRSLLKKILQQGTYWKSLILCLSYTYSLCFLLCLYYFFKESFRYGENFWDTLFGALIMPAFYLIWLAPVTIPLSLLFGLLSGFLFQYLYNRRDYLPEEI